jgi:hypothetical protein
LKTSFHFPYGAKADELAHDKRFPFNHKAKLGKLLTNLEFDRNASLKTVSAQFFSSEVKKVYP